MRRPPAWSVFLAAGMLATAGYFAVPAAWLNPAFAIVSLAGVVAIASGVAVHRPQRIRIWWLIVAGQFLSFSGDAIWTFYEDVLGHASPFPSIADAAYLAGYIPLVVALALIARVRHPGGDAAELIDAGIVTVAAGVALWVFLVAPRPEDPDALTAVVSIAYPLAGLVLIGLAVQLQLVAPARIPALVLVLLSLLALILADLGYAFANLHDVYYSGHPIDALWLLSYVTWGAAALHPSMRVLTESGRTRRVRRLTSGRLVALGAAALALPAMLGFQALRGVPEHVEVMAAGSALVFLLVLARLAGLTTALEAATLHDPLTGLPNRRLMLDRLSQAVERYRRTSSPVVVLFCDLDGFKALNDRLGHAAGDEVLAEVGDRLRAATRASDTVARIGGDEFVIVCEGVDEAEAARIAQRMSASVERPIALENRQVSLTLAIGIAVSGPGVQGADELLVAADRAMYRRKAESEADRTYFDIPRDLEEPESQGLD